MAWLTFDKLTPSQAVVAQQQLDASVIEPFLKKLHHREFFVVDGEVKGSRPLRTKRDQQVLNALIGPREVPSKTSLHGWTGGPKKWSLDP